MQSLSGQVLGAALAVLTSGCGDESQRTTGTGSGVAIESPDPTSAPEQADTSWVALSGERVAVPGTGLSLERPDRFQVARGDEGFLGFSHRARGSSIVMMRFPTALDNVRPGVVMGLPEQGLSIESREDVHIEDMEGTLLTGIAMVEVPDPRSRENTTIAQKVGRHVLIFGNDQEAFLLTANVPEAHWAVARAPLRSALMSARTAETGEAAGPFELGDATPLERSGAPNPTGGIVFIDPARDPAEDPSAPLFLSSLSTGTVEGRLSEFAIQRTAALPGVTDLDAQVENLTLDGRDAARATGTYTDRDSRDQRFVQLTIVSEPGGRYALLSGLCSIDDRGELEPVFERIAAGYHRSR